MGIEDPFQNLSERFDDVIFKYSRVDILQGCVTSDVINLVDTALRPYETDDITLTVKFG